MHASLLAWSQAPTCATKPGSAAITDHRCWAAEKRSRLPASTEQVIHFTNVIVQTQPPAAIAKVPPFRRASEERSTKIALSCGSSSRGVRDRLLIGPAREFCRDVLEELHREAADVVVVDTMIPSARRGAARLGAEVAGVPTVIVMHSAYMVPRAEVPPLGTGFLPASGR